MIKPPYTKWINDIKTKLGFTRTMTASGADVVDAVNKIADEASRLDSEQTETTDVLALALTCTKTTFFKMSSASSYTGNLPSNDYKGSAGIINVRGGGRFVIITNSSGGIATNYYNGSSWSGWSFGNFSSLIQDKFKISQFNATLTTQVDASTFGGNRGYILITSAVDPNYNSDVVATIPLYCATTGAPGRPLVVTSDANYLVKINAPVAYTETPVFVRVLYIYK